MLFDEPLVNLDYKLREGEFDPAKRRDIIIKMQKIIQDDAATLVFGYPQTNMISSKAVEHADIKPCDYYWITKDITPAK